MEFTHPTQEWGVNYYYADIYSGLYYTEVQFTGRKTGMLQ